MKRNSERNDVDHHVTAGLETLRLLTDQGCDLSRPRLTTHSFSGGADALDMLGVSLRGTGYTVEESDGGTLTASTLSVVDEGWLRESMRILCRVADYFGVDYLGWEAHADVVSH
jgi:Regulator of ribonuclease activity B